jgi:WhiB family transcriptional regulator, redox-sensing transcriptional regulator
MDRYEVEALMQPGDISARDLIDALRRRPAWHDRAACRGMGPQLFFPSRGEDVRPAKEMCATCPVADECLAFSTTPGAGQAHGIWGGLSSRERRAARTGRQRRRVIPPESSAS